MLPPHHQRLPADETAQDKIARLEEKNAQLQQAVRSHAVIDQAIGVLIAVHRMPAAAGWDVLQEVSQHCNLKLRTIADGVIAWARGEPMQQQVAQELEAVLQRWRQRQQTAGCQDQNSGLAGAPGETTDHQGHHRPDD
ncbi:ANTAR domain-containing protein [Streptomyces sp. NPDC005727]|uniref:ANTAR domain-containing protein n=1 Tax=Streptomyces sp. NPDC005727 TaxID=3157053 RepID=UPI0033D6EE80